MSALEDIKKYAPGANESVVTNMEKAFARALSNEDTRMVAYSDRSDLAMVRETFVKGKLGIAAADALIDEAIADVGDQVDGCAQRLTVYYLLAERYGKLDVFA
ncbi:DUF2853 family protein [Leucobacter denitrificans]|uniref:DUF2853 family protein n=1 Tax=Leucobacter denitrificans TaxID=683042 RepID=A0A7G9S2N9_9MICO|nr:DUF2853 family protein [Leucobacter denitrificans]QNN62114.1 DUF2853 family protein [Leucobacter denitrificans]